MAIAKLSRALRLALCALLLGACAAQVPQGGEIKVPETIRRPGLPVVLVFMPLSPQMLSVHKGLRSELEDEFDVVTVEVNKATTPELMAARIKGDNPKCVVIMNNDSLHLYKEMQRRDKGLSAPPALVLMTAFLEEELKGVRGATGISYEVPGVSAFVRLRTLLKRPVKRIGVVHRQRFSAYIAKQKSLARQEKFDLVSEELGPEVTGRQIRKAVLRLIEEQKVDALWVLNDNGLLGQQNLLSQGWVRALKRKHIPVIVNIESLVSRDLRFGSFAVIPDHEALGVQAANRIFSMMEAGWKIESEEVELPLSVETVLDVTEARAHFGLDEAVIGEVNRLVGGR